MINGLALYTLKKKKRKKKLIMKIIKKMENP
jgi:hypothetical protein